MAQTPILLWYATIIRRILHYPLLSLEAHFKAAKGLLAGGASVHRREYKINWMHHWRAHFTYYPMVAAVARMAKSGQIGEDMLKLRQQSGGDINQCISSLTGHHKGGYTTSLLVFLSKIPSWTRNTDDSHGPYDRLTPFLDQGVSPPPSRLPPSETGEHLYHYNFSLRFLLKTISDRRGP